MLRKKLKYLLPQLSRFRYYSRFRVFIFDKERGIRRSFGEKLRLVLRPDSYVSLPFVDIDITTFCNLRCKRCAKCIPYYARGQMYSVEEIREGLELLTKYVDVIHVGNIIGGEPLLHPQLKEIIEICAANQKIASLELTTNGTMVPKDEVLQAMRDGRVTVHISQYDHIAPRLKKTEPLIAKLEEYGITYAYQYHSEWLDFGEIEEHDYSEEELARILIHCPMNSCAVYNQKKLYRCGRASYLDQHGVALNEGDKIELEKITDKREMGKKVRRFFGVKAPAACRYCEAHPQVIPSGEQMEEK